MAEVDASALAAIRKFLDTLIAHNIHVESAYLFGSYAKGAESKWSDIDVAIVSPDFTDDRFEEGVRLMKLSSHIDSRIESVPFRPDNFSDDDPLAWEIKRNGIKMEVE